MSVPRPPRHKFSTDELMALVDLFGVSESAQADIRAILSNEPNAPDAALFRYYNPGSRVVAFEKAVAEKLGSRFVLGVNSCTSALISALVAAGVGPGAEVIIPGFTFFATAAAVVVAKAIPVIAEIDETLGLDPADVEAKITPRTRAIIAVHMNGHPARIGELRSIADKHGLALIEDVAQSMGGTYQGKALGTWGHIGCFSLDAYKVIAAGESGVLVTDDEWLYTRAQGYHDTAACWRPDRYARERMPGELFCGENYRMSELSAAVALPQLEKLDGINAATRRIWNQLRTEIRLPEGARWVDGADIDGVCGYRLGILFDCEETARRVSSAQFGIYSMASGMAEGLRDWHAYWHWEHILEQKTATSEGCPFKCPHVVELPKYSADMCPQTRDILMRLGVMAIQPTDTPEWASAFAAEVNDNFAKCLA